ncbi:SPOR domain-containing protein [Lentisalinibacter orientalis]|uniref:SPOR domain-containing protein n=1 Tax=Lentisalinibacter orientalis TaxID=2992241 RepID=UPI0038696543
MDRSTKERLTGAIVLVAVAWLVIPVFLDGPEEETGTVRQSVDLPGQEGQPTRTRRIVLDPRSETVRGEQAGEKITDPPPATRRLPAPASGSATEEAPDDAVAAAEGASSADGKADSQADPEPPRAAQADAPDPASQAAREPEPEPEPEPETRPAAAPAQQQSSAAAESLWAVQLGSFSNEENAEGLAADLRDQGFPAFLSRVQSGGRTLHRVRVGPQGSRDEAEKVAAALAKAGQQGQVVTHP